MKTRTTWCLLVAGVALGVVVLVQAVASAQPPAACVPGGVGPYGAGYWAYPFYILHPEDRVPHFALYPPVYYSYPVPRSYGYSPFAYPPGFVTPDVDFSKPAVIQNRYVPQKATAAPQQDRQAAAPLRIVNPFVVDDASQIEALAASGAVEPRAPQVVYPSAIAQRGQ